VGTCGQLSRRGTCMHLQVADRLEGPAVSVHYDKL